MLTNFSKTPYISFHENLFRGTRFVSYVQRGGLTER
jgi:hypothetical protein